MATNLSFAARWGFACGTPFDAASFLQAHPQFGRKIFLKIARHNLGQNFGLEKRYKFSYSSE